MEWVTDSCVDMHCSER